MSVRMRVPEEALPMLMALTNSPDPVFVTDRHNRIVFWNQSAERILGYSAEEVVGTALRRRARGLRRLRQPLLLGELPGDADGGPRRDGTALRPSVPAPRTGALSRWT